MSTSIPVLMVNTFLVIPLVKMSDIIGMFVLTWQNERGGAGAKRSWELLLKWIMSCHPDPSPTADAAIRALSSFLYVPSVIQRKWLLHYTSHVSLAFFFFCLSSHGWPWHLPRLRQYPGAKLLGTSVGDWWAWLVRQLPYTSGRWGTWGDHLRHNGLTLNYLGVKFCEFPIFSFLFPWVRPSPGGL